MSDRAWTVVPIVLGIVAGLWFVNSIFKPAITSGTTSVGPSSAAPSGVAGPREAQLNEAIADCERRGYLGRLVLADANVQATIARARTVCRTNDALYGQGNVGSDIEANNALGDVYTAMSDALNRFSQNLRNSTGSR